MPVDTKDGVTLSRSEVRALVQTLAELENLVEQTTERIIGIENIVLKHLLDRLDEPQTPRDETLRGLVRRTDDEKLQQIIGDTGMGPNRKVSGVVVYSTHQ